MRLLLAKILILLSLTLALPGCETLKKLGSGGDSGSEEEYAGWEAKQFHEKARAAMDGGNYQKAIKLYEALEARFPFGEYAAQTQLDVAYAYYKNDDPEAAIAAADRFIKIHPRNPSVDYAYYLKGLVNYNRGIGFLDRFMPTDSTQRDPGNARDSYDNFAELIRRFPDSKYVPDAKQRMIALRNKLAMYEVHVARFYMKRRAYIAAANRASHVVEEYQRTPAVPYALKIMHRAYSKLNLTDLATDAERVYQQNFPDGPPVADSPEDKLFIEEIWDITGLEE
jgi:outer membrane protein assembly factor BamD